MKKFVILAVIFTASILNAKANGQKGEDRKPASGEFSCYSVGVSDAGVVDTNKLGGEIAHYCDISKPFSTYHDRVGAKPNVIADVTVCCTSR